MVIGDRRCCATYAKSLRPSERDLRTHLDVQLEHQRLALVEAHIMEVRRRRDLELLATHDFLIRLLEQRLQRLLANRILEAFANERGRRLAGTEAGQSH